MEAIVIDTETTNADDDAEVIELAHAELTLHETGIGYRTPICQKFKPKGDISFGAMAVHHILPRDVAGHAHFDAAVHVPQTTYMVGHNVDFDWKRVGEPGVKRICTLALARKHMPECDSHSLSALMYFITPKDELHVMRNHLRGAHSAEADIIFCVKLLAELQRTLRAKSWEELYMLSEEARVPERMTFGKHKGEPVWMVDNGYRQWYSRQPDQDPYLLEAFRRYPYGKAPK